MMLEALVLGSLTVGLVVGGLVVAAAIGLFTRRSRRQTRELATDASGALEALERFAWCLGVAPDKELPGPDDDPIRYTLPGGNRTNSCEEARKQWLNACDVAHHELEQVLATWPQHPSREKLEQVIMDLDVKSVPVVIHLQRLKAQQAHENSA